jgi:hypothetical protein
MAKTLHESHRCFGQPPEIVVSLLPKGFSHYKIWGIWVSDGVELAEACIVSDHDTYYRTLLPAMNVAFQLQKMNQFNGWPIGLYYGSDGFDTHTRHEVLTDTDAIQHILSNE